MATFGLKQAKKPSPLLFLSYLPLQINFKKAKGFTMKFRSSKRAAAVQYPIRDIVTEARKVAAQGKKMYYLNIGDPLAYDFRTPRHLWDAVNAHQKEGECYEIGRAHV